jgi:hypothetical protein
VTSIGQLDAHSAVGSYARLLNIKRRVFRSHASHTRVAVSMASPGRSASVSISLSVDIPGWPDQQISPRWEGSCHKSGRVSKNQTDEARPDVLIGRFRRELLAAEARVCRRAVACAASGGALSVGARRRRVSPGENPLILELEKLLRLLTLGLRRLIERAREPLAWTAASRCVTRRPRARLARGRASQPRCPQRSSPRQLSSPQ